MVNPLKAIFKMIIVKVPRIPHFKGFKMINLQYEIEICRKTHNKVTMTTQYQFGDLFYESVFTYMTRIVVH